MEKYLKLIHFPENIQKSFLDIFEKGYTNNLIPYNRGKNDSIEEINEALEYGKRNKDYLKAKDNSFETKFKKDSLNGIKPFHEENLFLTKEDKKNLKNNKNLGILSDDSVSQIVDKIRNAISSPNYINPITKNLDQDSVLLVMPSSTGKNIIPSLLSHGIKNKLLESKGINIPVISGFAKPEHFYSQEDKIGIDNLIDPVSWKVNESMLNKFRDKKFFIVDDIFDSGESSKKLIDNLKNFNVQKKIINLGVGDHHDLKPSKNDIIYIIEKYQNAYPDLREKDIHDALHYNIGGKSPQFIKRLMSINLNDDKVLKTQRKNLLELIKDFKTKEQKWQKDFQQ